MIFKPAPREVPLAYGRVKSDAWATVALILTRRAGRIVASTAHTRAGAITAGVLIASLIIWAMLTLWVVVVCYLLAAVVFIGYAARRPQAARLKVRSCWRSMWVYRRRWGKLLARAGVIGKTDVALPMVYSIHSTGDMDTVRLGLRASGKKLGDFADNAENLWRFVKALDCRTYEVPGKPNQLDLRFMVRDSLVRRSFPPFPPPASGDAAIRELMHDGLLILVDEDYRPERLPINYHLLIGGETGAGKTNVELAIIDRLYPAYADGLVNFWAAETKGSDFIMAKHLLTEYVRGDRMHPRRHEQQFIRFFEKAVRELQLRIDACVGERDFVPSRELPYLILFADDITEMASQAISPAARRRLRGLLGVLLGDGRQPGVMVVAACNHPGLEVVPFRRGFPSKSGLRLDSHDQLRMLYGFDAYRLGCRCDKIAEAPHGNGITFLQKPRVGFKRCKYVSVEHGRVAGYQARVGGTRSLVDDQVRRLPTRKPRFGGFNAE